MKAMGLHNIVLKYMQNHRGGLTVKQAIETLGTTELRKIISDLRTEGWVFADTWETGTNRWGEPTRYKKYVLVGKKSK